VRRNEVSIYKDAGFKSSDEGGGCAIRHKILGEFLASSIPLRLSEMRSKLELHVRFGSGIILEIKRSA
jgi:hypothetical protein